jgi:cell surface protein SprA
LYKNSNQPITKYFIWVYLILWICSSSLAQQPSSNNTAQNNSKKDSTNTIEKSGKAPKMNFPDQYPTRISSPGYSSPFYLKNYDLYRYNFQFNPEGSIEYRQFQKDDKAGLSNYRNSESLSLDRYNQIQNKDLYNRMLRQYSSASDGVSDVSGRGLKPKLFKSKMFDNILGQKIDLQPNGFVSVEIGAFFQNSDNPLLPIRQRKFGQFVFNQQASFNLTGGIGDLMKINTNFDTKASFNFQNQLKLNYQAQEEDIVQNVEAGNINFNLPTTLISGVSNLIGFKTNLRFGKLDAQLAVSQQRSKVESIYLRGGSQAKGFEIRCDNYDENRHFFLSQFFRKNYEGWLKNMPIVLSGVNITRIEVYVTNRTGNTETLRNIAGFADLGEQKPYKTTIQVNPSQATSNNSNKLFDLIKDRSRAVDNLNTEIQNNLGLGLQRGEDFELLRGAKKLTERDYHLNAQMGYISLLTPLKNDEVLAVSYEYTYQGRQYKVGELTEDYQARTDDQVLFMKLLKSSTIRNNLSNPMWDLMMKNVYSLNTNSLAREGFQLRIIYKDDQTGIDNPNLQEGIKTKDVPLIRLLGLDRLNQQLDIQADGNFDFVEGTTVDTRFGKIIFPVLEPFGSTLRKQFTAGAEDALIEKYVFDDLYRKTLADAQQVTRKNKFFLKGNMQGGGGGASGGGAPIQLPFGVDAATVVVSAGGVALSSGTDYVVEPAGGQLRILNQSIMSSGREIRIDYERPDLFSNQIRTMLGGRFDYNLSKDIRLGATIMKYKETPSGFLTRVAIGNEPTNNTIIGFDAGIRKESRFLTKAIDFLPLIQTKEKSQIDFQGEFAQLFPGVAPRVNGNSFIDDFEGSRVTYDLSRQALKWKLAATPDTFKVNAQDQLNIRNNDRRAKISAYNADMTFYGVGGGLGLAAPTNFDEADQNNVYERRVNPNDIFKGKDIQAVGTNFPVSVFDISYFPHERGPYNYNFDLDPNGLLKNPKKNFGAITRAIPSDIDFDNANIEILEFWMLDPFKDGTNGIVKDGIFNKNNTTGGKLEIHLGDISEDVIPDSRFNFENGFPINENDPNQKPPSTSVWGRAPSQQFTTNAFDNRPGSREKQDIGLDGLNNLDEQSTFKLGFLDRLPTNLLPDVKQKILNDPSGDDYKFYFSPEFNEITDANKKLVYRYKDALGMENNSPESANTGKISLSESGSNLPDMEDLNVDNTINDIEAYYKFDIDLKPNQLKVGGGYVVDEVNNGEQGTWYLMRIPIRSGKKVGNINGFKSIRFARILLTDFEQPVVLRFGQLQLTSFQYRKYTKDISVTEKPGLDVEEPNKANTLLKVSTVSIEENQTGNGVNVPYRVPPGFQRDRDITSFNNVQLNEQSLSLCVDNLKPGDSRGVFKNTNYDLLSYENLKLFVHLDGKDNTVDRKINAFMRLGTDLSENYYEIEKVALVKSSSTSDPTSEEVWLEQNNIDVALEQLRFLKLARDKANFKFNEKYTENYENFSGKYKLTVVGRPDLSSIQTMMLGVRSPTTNTQDLNFCVWMDELRINGFNQTAGYAAVGKLNLKLADFATVTMTGAVKTFGFGSVQQRISERNRDTRTEFGIASNVAMDKLFPMKWGLQIPLFISYDNALITPKFDPLDPDMYLADVASVKDQKYSKPYRNYTDDRTVRRGFNFANIRKAREGSSDKSHLYDIENFSLSYAFNDMKRYSVLIDEYSMKTYRGGVTYNYQNTPGIWEPFKNSKKMLRPSLAPIKDFNLSLAPTSITLKADMDRSFVKTQLRNSDLTILGQLPLYEKYWLFNRLYDINWNLSKSLILNYNASANAIIDEPYGDLNNETALDSVRRNLRNWGRPKLFNQNITSTWRVPLDKFPVLDWMTADYSWKVGANYTAGTFGVRDDYDQLYGNIVRNNRDQMVTGKIDLVALYNKVKYLKFANSPDAKKVVIVQNPGAMEDIPVVSSKVLKKFTRVLMAVRGINYTISMQEATVLPGFLPAPKYFGMGKNYLDNNVTKSVNTFAPGLPFILGSQNISILDKAKNNDWLTRSTQQNLPFTQTRTKRIEFRTQIEPTKDLQIQLEARWNRTDNYQEFYRVDSTTNNFKSFSPVRSGNFTMSYLSFLTAFKLTNSDGSSDNFNTFLDYRENILKRLKEKNSGSDIFNKNSQDVLLPAFFAAYSGKDPNKVSLSPFRGVPLPNWRLNYKGLANMEPFSKWFTTLELSHAYSSSYSVGNFVSSLDYFDENLLRFNQDNSRVHFLGFDTNFNYPLATQLNNNKQSVPVYMMSIISFTEKFGPFVGLNFRTKSKWTGRLEYNQDRNISLNLSNSSVSELINKDWVVTLGATKNNLRVPFKVNGKTVRLKNDMTFNMNFTLRDQRATLRRIDAESVPTSGQLMLQFRPQVQYAVDKKLNVSVYIDRMLNNPYVLTSFRRATTQGGIQIRYSLTP